VSDVDNVKPEEVEVKGLKSSDKFRKTIQLPSKGYLYSEDSPLYGTPESPNGNVDIRPIKTREEKLIRTIKVKNPFSILEEVSNSCVLTKGIDFDNLLVGDSMYLLLELLYISYRKSYTNTVRCPACSNTVSFSFNVPEDLYIKGLDDDATDTFEVVLEGTGAKVKLRMKRNTDERAVQKFLTAQGAKGSGGDDYIYSMARQVVSIDGKDSSWLDSIAFMDDLYSFDLQTVRDVIEEHDCGIKLEKKICCNGCGQEILVPIKVNSLFF